MIVVVQVFTYQDNNNKGYTILIKDQSQTRYVVIYCSHTANYLPSLSSPKFPQPIFFPTLKFGPTMRTPDDVEEFELLTLLLTALLLGLVCRLLWSPPSLRFPFDAIILH